MRNYLRSSVAALGYGLLTAAALAPTVALAQPVTAPRQFNTQQVHYIRATINFQMCTQVANTCVVRVPSSLPYNSVVVRVIVAISTAFNSTTSDVIFVGTTQSGANDIVGGGCTIHAVTVLACTVAPGSINALGNNATQTGLNGGFDLWIRWTAGTGNTATTGLGAVIIEYAAPNDGGCTVTPMGATNPGC